MKREWVSSFQFFFALVGLPKNNTPNAEVGVFHQPYCCRDLLYTGKITSLTNNNELSQSW